ncbi:hypothetical protein DXV76_18250 [Rhodobacteraceae bacterium CCMM004]|nr:hypothetical protein DXV76_18250 [Rhodobacteraceae bacterium CCMM004]
MTRLALAALLSATVVAGPAMADEARGVVIAFDRFAQIIVLDDKTVWTLRDGGAEAPEGLVAGDTVVITYEGTGEDGFGVIESIAIES